MNIYHIFVTVVRLGGFSAAAKQLHRSPSSISKKMSQLEQRLNTQLFDRTTRNLAITEAGQRYYERCLEIDRLITLAEDELDGLSDDPSGTVTITWPNTISSTPLVGVLARFGEAFPEIKLNVRVINEHLNLIDEHIDFAFRMNPVVDSSMVAIELFTLQPVLCASPAFLARHGQPKSVDELPAQSLLLLNNSSAIQKFWKSLLGMSSLDMDAYHRVDDINALRHMAKEGVGLTLLFEHMIQDNLKQGDLLEVLPTLRLEPQPVYLMFHKNDYRQSKYSAFVDFLKRHYLQSQ